MKALRILGVALACALLGAGPPGRIYGFGAASSTREFQLEATLIDVPSAQAALDAATAIAARPHAAGSDGDRRLAVYVRDRLAADGFDSRLEAFTAMVETPERLRLELIPTGRAALRRVHTTPTVASLFERLVHARPAPTAPSPSPSPASVPQALNLAEPPDPADPQTDASDVGLPFESGSADGDVTAPLVYAGRGLGADYGVLASHHVTVTGAVVLVRSGAAFRGELVRRAQAHGAVGALLYDDPADDGFARGPVYPRGPWRPESSVERGDLGAGITIPVLPISALNAKRLLAALRGPRLPAPWAGALDVGYPVARGPAAVHLVVRLARRTATLWNTIGVLPGEHRDGEVLLGANRDAWVYGVGDDGSGVVTLLETARALGYLAKSGWQPQRSIVVAAWDGTESGSDGERVYARRHRDALRTTVAYLNADQNVTGPRFGADASAAVASIVLDAASTVADPAQPSSTLYQHWILPLHGALPPMQLHAGAAIDREPTAFGLGTPRVNAGFTGPLGPYHSLDDDLHFATTISDPDFTLHRTTAQLYGIMALRLADADVVPYRFTNYLPQLRTGLGTVLALARSAHLTVDVRGLSASAGRFAAAANRFDAATARTATRRLADRTLEAARILDLALYGANDEPTAVFPELRRAIAERDQGKLDAATLRLRATLERAAALIAT